MSKEEELYCHYSDLPSPSAYKEIIEIPLDNNVEIKYQDGTKHTINDKVKFTRGLLNGGDSPIVDHCV